MRATERVCACALLLFTNAALGADQGFYFGLAGGQAKYDFDRPPLFAIAIRGGLTGMPRVTLPPVVGFNPPVFSVPAFSAVASPVVWFPDDDDKDTAWGLTAGYRAGRYVAVELSYLNLGTLKASDTILVPPIIGGGTLTLKRELETSGPAFSALGILPLSDSWELYLRAGIFFADMELTTSLGGSSGSTTFGSEAVSLGAGAQFDWGEHWAGRLEFQRVLEAGADDGSEADIDALSLGIFYRL